ncbi:MAG: AI-2E family transporter [Candidatus Palauibacterales bacterium]|nr:AI-2E family transporter [Candidatus Palauibacterales bacterium]MDP2528796.1 AI-2E family transporter [Candidatus Palauibacterales bacterium]
MDARSVRGRVRLLVTAVVLVLLLLFVYSVADLLILLFLSVLFSIYLGTVTDWFQRRLRLPRPVGIVVSVLATLLFIGGIGVLLAPPLTAQATQLVTALPRQLAQWERSLSGLQDKYPFLGELFGTGPQGGSYFGSLFRQIGQYVTGAVPYLFNGIWFFVHVVSLVAISIYLTTRPGLYRGEVLQLIPPRHRDAAADIVDEMGTTLRSWLGGQLLAMFVLGSLTWVGLQFLGVPFALAFGVFAGLVAIVPFFGTLFSTVLPALFVLPDNGIVFALVVASVGAGVHLLEANVVSPLIFEERVELPPAWTLLALLILAKLLGAIGLLVAVPVLACVRVLIHRIYIERILEGGRYLPRRGGHRITLRLPGTDDFVLASAGRGRSVPDLVEALEGKRRDARNAGE